MPSAVTALRSIAILGAMTAAIAADRSGGAAAQTAAERSRLLVELSSTLGASHHLRRICADEDDQRWRLSMQDLIALENPDAATNDAMIAAFNEAYAAASSRYAECSRDARARVEAVASEGAALAARLRESLPE